MNVRRMPTIPEDERATIGSLVGVQRLCELGNKRDKQKIPYRAYYESFGIEYWCIDWNGKDGAIKWDMREPFKIHTQSDMVTNFGFTEHVTEQQQCWQNIVDLLKVGGLLVCVTPTPGHWEQHGYWQPEISWYTEFAFRHEFEIEELLTNTNRVRPVNCCRMKKTKEVHVAIYDMDMHRTPVKF